MTNTQNGTVNGETIVDFASLDSKVQQLVNAAIQVRCNAYCPYSNFAVGAALRTTTGEVFTGCNVENGAFGPTVCAERTAICKAVSEGFRQYEAIAVVAYQETQFTSPCGTCRQTLSEFCDPDFPVYIAKPAAARVMVTSLYTLLPHAFSSSFLKK
ncbi:cytidine deaminase-like [Malaya genurostris]|uniref:cytidine deaminase-like n=1 Tax=Malaya genurostris TaxID=325434 RepID=UPI0026F3E58B|nr:cytidine deaminase-like [Malaya genurostris]